MSSRPVDAAQPSRLVPSDPAGNPLWNWVADPAQGKPYFHPITTGDGSTLTALRPEDHPWHRGLWWSWKFINGVNYWEEDRETGLSQGRTEIVTHHIRQTPSGESKIDCVLHYHPVGGETVLKETRSIRVSAPNEAGDYFIDWTSSFVAPGDDVQLDRTPIPGEAGGMNWGGYAGLSARLAAGLEGVVFSNSEGQQGAAATHGKPARWMQFWSTGGGMAIFDHPTNLRHPTPWYVAEGMPFFSPALLFDAPHTLSSGQSLKLRHRVLIHSHPKTPAELEGIWQKFSQS